MDWSRHPETRLSCCQFSENTHKNLQENQKRRVRNQIVPLTNVLVVCYLANHLAFMYYVEIKSVRRNKFLEKCGKSPDVKIINTFPMHGRCGLDALNFTSVGQLRCFTETRTCFRYGSIKAHTRGEKSPTHTEECLEDSKEVNLKKTLGRKDWQTLAKF